jgi:hypothetical protein
MDQIKNELLPVKRLSPPGGHYFFGYYDLPAWDRTGQYHLAHKVPFMDRIPGPEDTAVLGTIRGADSAFVPVAETTAWNFQQGSMLQWHPTLPGTVIYNVRRDSGYGSVVRNLETGETRSLPLPAAAVDPQGQWALSVNFSRLYDFRPGYGYAGIPDPRADIDQPEDDGIFLMDLESGETSLILSLRDIAAHPSRLPGLETQKLAVNHITFNTDGSRFVFIVRNFPLPGKMWGNGLFTANRDGSGLHCLSDYGYSSHYYWKNSRELLIHGDGDTGEKDLFVYRDLSGEKEKVDPAFFLEDGHCSYSPDRSRILYDSYPDGENYRHLYLYDVPRKRGITLASLYSSPASNWDYRCDLHPRWNRDGTVISFDSTHEGFRGIYFIDNVHRIDHIIHGRK